MRNSYKTETGWAPPHVGTQLRDVRLGAETMRLKAIRAEAEARAAKDQAVAARHADIAAEARGLEAQHREHETWGTSPACGTDSAAPTWRASVGS